MLSFRFTILFWVTTRMGLPALMLKKHTPELQSVSSQMSCFQLAVTHNFTVNFQEHPYTRTTIITVKETFTLPPAEHTQYIISCDQP